MKRLYTQKEIYGLLCDNPLKLEVHIGDLEDMQGKDYIFLDYFSENSIGSDNDGVYQTIFQISIATKDFEKRKQLVNYIKTLFYSSPTYTKSDDSEYYIAQFNIGVFIRE